MAKLTDAERGARVRAGDKRRSERRRERLAAAGKIQLLTWVSHTTREALEQEAVRRGLPIGQTTAAVLQEALNSYSPAERLAAVTAANHDAERSHEMAC